MYENHVEKENSGIFQLHRLYQKDMIKYREQRRKGKERHHGTNHTNQLYFAHLHQKGEQAKILRERVVVVVLRIRR